MTALGGMTFALFKAQQLFYFGINWLIAYSIVILSGNIFSNTEGEMT